MVRVMFHWVTLVMAVKCLEYILSQKYFFFYVCCVSQEAIKSGHVRVCAAILGEEGPGPGDSLHGVHGGRDGLDG